MEHNLEKPILVVSHERSGTHLTLNSFGENQCANLPIDTKEVVDNFLKEYQGNRILKSHHQSYFFEDYVYDKYNVVYVKRDPLDVMTSMFFYHKTNKTAFPQHNTIEEFVFGGPYNPDKYSLDKSNHFLERWSKHVKSFEGKKVTVVTYEEIVNDYDSFKDRMNNKGITCIENKPILGIGQSVNPRKGIIGDYKNHMSESLINEIKNYLE